MDLISHALLGGLVASSVGLQKKYGLAASATMVVANLIPDIDGALTVFGPKYFFQYHRNPLTHSVGGAALISAVITTAVYLATPLKRPALVFGISFVGILLHLLSDLLTPWPIPLLWPFSTRTYSLDLINFLDLFLLAVLGGSFVAVNRWPERGALVLAAMLLVALSYLGFRAFGRHAAIRLVADRTSTSQIAALPHGLSLTEWDVVMQDGRDYTYHLVDSLQSQVRSSQVIRSAGDERTIAASRDSALVQAFLKRARFPVAFVTEENGKSIVEWRDVHLMINGGALRGVRVILDEQGKVVEEKFEVGIRN